MTPRRFVTRRGVLIGMVAILGSAATASVLACRPGTGTAALDLDRLRLALSDIMAPERVGHSYRQDRDTATLLEEFGARPALAAAASLDCPDMLRSRIRAVAQEDFRTGDIVIADRFVMARSECIVAALAT